MRAKALPDSWFQMQHCGSYVNLLVGDTTLTGASASTLGDGGLAVNAGLMVSNGVATDAAGNIYISDSNRIRMVPHVSGTYFGQSMTANYIYTIAGDLYNLTSGSPTSGTIAASQYLTLFNFDGIAADSSGNVFFNDSNDGYIFMIANHSGTFFNQSMTAGYLYIVVGNGTSGTSGNGGPATSAATNGGLLATDGIGNLYIADSGNNRIQMVPAVGGTYFGQNMTATYMYTIAGSSAGTAGDPGAGGVLGTSALITSPETVAIDSAGNVYFNSQYNNTNYGVYMMPSASGNYFGQAMTASNIYRLTAASANGTVVAVDLSKNIFYTSSGTINMIPYANGTYFGQVMTKGTSYTIAPVGSATTGLPNGLSPASYRFAGFITGLATDPNGNILVSQWENSSTLINDREIVATITASAGTYYGRSMLANKIYTLVGSANPLSTNATSGTLAYGSPLAFPQYISYDSSNNLYISNWNFPMFSNIQMVPAVSGTYFGTAMTANKIYTLKSNIGLVQGMATDPAGNLVFINSQNLLVLAGSNGTYYGTAMTNGQVYTLAGSGANQGSGVTLSNVSFSDSSGLGVDSAGNVYVADANGGPYRIVMIPKTTGTYFGQAMTANLAYTIVGGNGQGTSGIGGLGTAATIYSPFGSILIDSNGSLIFVDDNRILMLAAKSGNYYGQNMTAAHLYVIGGASNDAAAYGSADGILATSAPLANLQFPSMDSLGNIYFPADTCRIRMIPRVSGNYFGQSMLANYIYTLNSSSMFTSYSASGTLAGLAYFNNPRSVAIDKDGNVGVADSYNYSIRVITVAQ